MIAVQTNRLWALRTDGHIGLWLGLGVFFFPVLFVWFLLRDGYSFEQRAAAVAWLVLRLVYPDMFENIGIAVDQWISMAL